ncbi:hypothetical protein CR51_01495 [Caballeronia megalochromosomata]|nr:hypothetical protein CR51_01495 [Caballeronia megalochromosomata]
MQTGRASSALFQRIFRIGGSDMMAFMFFLLWMLASLGLLTVWVFRQTPSAGHDKRAPSAVAES